MIIDLIVKRTDDGFTGEVPSLKGCESWAAEEDEVIEKCVELTVFYLKLADKSKIAVDRARRSGKKTVYKLIFNKN